MRDKGRHARNDDILTNLIEKMKSAESRCSRASVARTVYVQ